MAPRRRPGPVSPGRRRRATGRSPSSTRPVAGRRRDRDHSDPAARRSAKHWTHHDRRRITAINGRTIRLDRAAHLPAPGRQGAARRHPPGRGPQPHPQRRHLRNASGRAHVIMLMTTRPQRISHVWLRHMGPRHGEDEVLGRYALHFHADHDGSRGSLVDGVVVSDSTGHAFAAHLSNGVTFRRCVAHDIVDDAFWWDLGLHGGRDLVPSHDIVYDRCVAHFVKSGGNSKFNLTGFLMGPAGATSPAGASPPASQGGSESSAGFHWPSHSRDDNTWTFVDNLAHNNRHSGIYFWQNGAPRTIVTRFTAYHCGQGIFAGSYANLASYRRCTIYACKQRRPRHLGAAVEGRQAHRGDDHLRADVRRSGRPQRLRRPHHQAPQPGRAGDADLGFDVPRWSTGPDRAARRRQSPAALRLHQLPDGGQQFLAGARPPRADPVARAGRGPVPPTSSAAAIDPAPCAGHGTAA